jgi:hypothetical protein
MRPNYSEVVMPIPPKKLQAFANQQKGGGGGGKPFGGGGPPKGDGGGGGGKKKLQAFAGKGKHGGGDGGHDDEHGDKEKHVDIDGIIERVDNGDGEPHLMDMAAGSDGSGEHAPDGVHDEGMWKKAVGMLKSRWDDLDDPVAVALHVYHELGGKAEGDDHKEPDGDEGEHGHEPDHDGY